MACHPAAVIPMRGHPYFLPMVWLHHVGTVHAAAARWITHRLGRGGGRNHTGSDDEQNLFHVLLSIMPKVAHVKDKSNLVFRL
jgi:hypothetical protein